MKGTIMTICHLYIYNNKDFENQMFLMSISQGPATRNGNDDGGQ